MPSTISSGKDGIIRIGSVAEIPRLTSWTLQSSASHQGTNVLSMRSNTGSSGSSGSSGNDWDVQELTARNWTIQCEFFWQKIAAGASPLVDLTDIGALVAVRLIPSLSGYYWEGSAYLQSVAVVASVNGKLTQSATLLGDGTLTQTSA